MRTQFQHYRFVDWATQAYLLFVALLLILFHNGTVPEWRLLVPGHLVAMGLIHALVNAQAGHPRSRILDFLRHTYPILLYTGFYRETGALNLMFMPEYADPIFIRLDQLVFGAQPSVAFMDRLPFIYVSEIFYASYFSYYLMIAGVGVALLMRNRQHFFHYVSVTSFVFYVCYVIYIFLPVMGPRAFSREIEGYRLPEDVQSLVGDVGYPAAVQAGPFFRIMAFIYHNFEAPGAAFPSSHVAIAWCTVFFSFRYFRSIRWFHAVVAVLLSLATVYCRYHYAVDVLAGLLTTAVLVPLGERLYRGSASTKAARSSPSPPGP